MYEPPQRSGAKRPLRGAGFLEGDYEAIGLTGDDEGVDVLDESFALLKNLIDFEDYSEVDDEDEDDKDWSTVCGQCDDQEEVIVHGCKECSCAQVGGTIEESPEGATTPPDRVWTAVD